MEAMVWLILLAVFIAIELATMGLTTIWFAVGSLAAMFAAIFGWPLFIQIALFLIVSALTLAFIRPIAMRCFNGRRVRTNVEEVIGKRAVVTERIDNVRATGVVTLDGREWTARSAVATAVLEPGSIVVVRAVEGVKLIVELAEEGK